jgi:inorganic pyrophosphatase
MNKHKINLFLLSVFILLISCEPRGYKDVPHHAKNGALHTVIEIPAGSTQKVKYEAENQGFKYFKENGIIQRIKYLPSPVNFGFVPSTNDDGEFAKIILISESLSSGSIVEVDLIGAVEISSPKGKQYCMISLPRDENMQTLKSNNLEEILGIYPEFKQMLESWFSEILEIEKADFRYVDKKNAEIKLRSFVN